MEECFGEAFGDKNQNRKEVAESESICKSNKNKYLYHGIKKQKKKIQKQYETYTKRSRKVVATPSG